MLANCYKDSWSNIAGMEKIYTLFLLIWKKHRIASLERFCAKKANKEEMSLKCLHLSDEREYKVGSQKTFLKL
jgi:hypothetical protein